MGQGRVSGGGRGRVTRSGGREQEYDSAVDKKPQWNPSIVGDLVKCPVYSGTPLLWTPWGPMKCPI